MKLLTYGVLMNEEQMHSLCPNAKKIGKIVMPQYALRIRIPYKSEIGCLTMEEDTKDYGGMYAETPCVIWEITEEDFKKLKDWMKGYETNTKDIDFKGNATKVRYFTIPNNRPFYPMNQDAMGVVYKAYQDNGFIEGYEEELVAAMEEALNKGSEETLKKTIEKDSK